MQTFYSTLLIFTTSMLITLAYPTFGQQNNASSAKNELGISLLSYASRPSSNIRFSQTFYVHPFRAVSYKRHFGRSSAIRLSVAGQQLIRRQPMPDIFFSEGDYEAILIKAGWERSFTSGRLSPYVATDLIGIKSSSVGAEGGGIVARYREFATDQRGIGLSPTLGLRYRPLRWLSLFAETSLDIIYSRYRSQYTQTLPEIANLHYTENTAGFGGKFNPMSMLVLSVLF